MKWKTVLIGIIIIAVIISVGFGMFYVYSHMVKTSPRRARKANNPMPVQLVKVKVRTIHDVIGASGHTKEFENVTLTARITQPVVSVEIELGQFIKKGKVLVRFEQRVILAKVVEAKERIAKTETDLQNRIRNYRRLQNIYDQKLISKLEVEEADEAMKTARVEHANALLILEQAKQEHGYTTVKSPVDGIVLSRPINAGEIPQLDAVLINIGLIDNVYMMANISETKISYVQLHQKAEIIFDSFRNEVFKGEIIKIDPKVDHTTRTFTAFIKIPNHDRRLTPGLSGFSRISNDRIGLSVPTISIINPIGDKASTFVVDDQSRAHLRKIKIGVVAEGVTEIIDGLKEGEKVVSAGIHFLKDGDQISIMGEKQNE